jgi:hypothetical protein
MSDTLPERIERELASVTLDPSASFGPRVRAEALHVARFADERYLPEGDPPDRLPGLTDARLPAETAAEIRHIVSLLDALDDIGPDGRRRRALPVEPARSLVRELRVFLAWLAEDDGERAARLESVEATHVRARTADDWAVALGAFRHLADGREAALREAPVFDAGLLDAVDAEIAAHAGRRLPRTSPMLRRRAALATLLRHRVTRVVRLAGLVFRNHPEVAAEVRSERLRRRIAKGISTRRGAASNDPTPTPET